MNDPYRWDIDDQSALIGALVTVAMVVGMLLRRRRRKTDLLFSIFATNLTLWFTASCLNGYYEGAWMHAELAVAALIPASLLALCSDLVRGTTTAARRLSRSAYPFSYGTSLYVSSGR